MKSIAVLGAGNSGFAMAAHLSLNGFLVNLWARSINTIKEIKNDKSIYCYGCIEGHAGLKLVTNDLREAIDDVDLIFVTTPAESHRDIAKQLALLVKPETLIILNPGRTFGILEFENTLQISGCNNLPQMAETQTTIYTCRKINPLTVHIIALKQGVLISTFNPSENKGIIDKLPFCLQVYFKPARSMIETSIGNVGMVLHCAPVLLNSGWIESPQATFLHYYDGISPSIARLLEKVDVERLEVARILGVPVESTADWICRSYEVTGSSLYECIQNNPAYHTIYAPTSLQHRYIFEDVSCGLVPLEAIGRKLGLSMNICGLVITLASELLEIDFRKYGRNLTKMGLDTSFNDLIIGNKNKKDHLLLR